MFQGHHLCFIHIRRGLSTHILNFTRGYKSAKIRQKFSKHHSLDNHTETQDAKRKYKMDTDTGISIIDLGRFGGPIKYPPVGGWKSSVSGIHEVYTYIYIYIYIYINIYIVNINLIFVDIIMA